MKIKSILLSSIVATSIFSGCSQHNIDVTINKEDSHRNSRNIYIFKGFKVSNTSLKTMLKKLSKYDGMNYILNGDDIRLENSPNIYITSLEDLQLYVRNTTDYELEVVKDHSKSSKLVVLSLKYKESNTFLEPFKVDVEGKGTLSDIFKEISRKTGYSLNVNSDVDKFFSSKVVSFTYNGTTLDDFIKYIENSKNVFVDIDHYNKIINIKKYKTYLFELPMISIFSDTKHTIENDNGGNGIDSIFVDKVDIYKDLEDYMSMILKPVDSNDELSKNSFYINKSSNKLAVRTDYITSKNVIEMVNDYIDTMQIQLSVNIDIYKVKIEDSVNWSKIKREIKERSNWIGEAYDKHLRQLINGYGKIVDVKNYSAITMNSVPLITSIGRNAYIYVKPKVLKDSEKIVMNIVPSLKDEKLSELRTSVIVNSNEKVLISGSNSDGYETFIIVSSRIEHYKE